MLEDPLSPETSKPLKEQIEEPPLLPDTPNSAPPIIQKKAKKKKKSKKGNGSSEKLSSKRSSSTSKKSATSDKPSSKKNSSNKETSDKKVKKDSKKKRKSAKTRSVDDTEQSTPQEADTTENDTTTASKYAASINSDEPWLGNFGPNQPIVSTLGPMNVPDLAGKDDYDASLNDEDLNGGGDDLHDSNDIVFGSKRSMEGSGVLEEIPPIGELVVAGEPSDHVSEIGENIIEKGEDAHSPSKKDVCFDDRGHPGTRIMTKTIRTFLGENQQVVFTPTLCKKIKKKLKGRRFLIRVRQNEETVWKEATKAEISELIREAFDEEKRRKTQGIVDDDSDVDSSLQDSIGQSTHSDPKKLPSKKSLDQHLKLNNGGAATPRLSNRNTKSQSNGINTPYIALSNEETAVSLQKVMEESRKVREYASRYGSTELQKQGVMAEQRLHLLLRKAATLEATAQNEELRGELGALAELMEQVKQASIAPMLEMIEKLDLHLVDYFQGIDPESSDYYQDLESSNYSTSLGISTARSHSTPGRGARHDRSLEVLESSVDTMMSEENDGYGYQEYEIEANALQNLPKARSYRRNSKESSHSSMVDMKGTTTDYQESVEYNDVDEPLRPGTYTETRLKGFSSDDESFSASVSYLSEDGQDVTASKSFTEGSQSLQDDTEKDDDGNEIRSTKSGHVFEISRNPYEDEMSSVGRSMPGIYGSDSSDNDERVVDLKDRYDSMSTDDDQSFSDTSDSATGHADRPLPPGQIPNPRLDQFFDRLQHFFEVRRKVEERADMVDPSEKLRNLKVKPTSGGIQKYNGKFKTEYQQTYGKTKIVRNLDDLYDAAESTITALEKVLDNMTDEVNGLDNESIEIADLKPRDRAYEKAKEEYSDRRPGPPESWLYDVVRASVLCKSYKQVVDVNKWLVKHVHIVSVKNRFLEPAFNGYRDLLFHICIPYRGKLTHICELQVHHKDIKALDQQFGLPKHYEFFRSCFSGPWRSQEVILDDLAMMNKYGDVGGNLMTKLLKSKDLDQLRLFAGLCREKLDEYDLALELYRRILILQEDLQSQDHESIASTHLSIGLVLGAKGEIDESLVHLQKALSMQESILGSDHIEYAELLTEIGRVLSKKGNYDGALSKYKKALDIREKRFGREHFLVINSLQDIGQVFRDLGDFMAADACYRKALKIQESVLGEVHPDVASTRHLIGTTLCQFGDFGKAMEEHRLALSIRETAIGKNHPMTAESHTDIGIVLCQKGDYEVAEWRHKKALRIREAMKGKEDEECAISLSYLGEVLSRKGDYEGAIQSIKRAQKIRERSLGMDHPVTAASYIDLGNVYYKKGDSELALKEFRRAKVGLESIQGQQHPDTALAYSYVGNALNLQGDYKAAAAMHKKALDILESVLGDKHPLTAIGYQNSADTYLLMGDKDGALSQHRKALSIRASVLCKDHPDTAVSCSRIGDLLAEKGDLVGALVAHRQALAITVGLCGEDNVDSAKGHVQVGLVLAAQGDYDEALDEFERAINVFETLLGENHEETGRAYSLSGSIHSARGHFDDALEMHTHALQIFETIYGDDHPKTEAIMIKCQMAEEEEVETEF